MRGEPVVRRKCEGMVDAMARFILDIKSGSAPRTLSLLGTTGVGKTMLAKRIWRWFDAVGKWYVEPVRGAMCVRTGQFCDWRKFIEDCLAEGDFSRSLDLCEDWFVVLDDIGSKRDKSGFGVDKLDTILARRCGRLWTVVTANLSVEEISDQLDARIASRLLRHGSTVVEVDMPDYNVRTA